MNYPHIVVAKVDPSPSLDVVDIGDAANAFDEAAKVWAERGCPEMWLVEAVGTAPWHVDGKPVAKAGKR